MINLTSQHSVHINESIESVKCYYQNTRGTRGKLKELRCNIPLNDYNIIIFTESWLKDSINDDELGFHDFFVYRCDRDYANLPVDRGGGVLIAIKKKYASQVVSNVSCGLFESLFVNVKIKSSNYLIGAVYIPPDSSRSTYSTYVDIVDDLLIKYQDSNHILIGDFNLPLLNWDHYFSDQPRSDIFNSDETSDIIIECMEYHGFHQVNKIKNNMDRMLDLILVNFTIFSLQMSDDPILKVDPLHPPLTFEFQVYNHIKSLDNNSCTEQLCFKKANFIGLKEHFNNVDWSIINENKTSLNNQIEYFYDVLNSGINQFVPLVKIGNFKFPPWFSQDLKNKTLSKKACHKQFKQCPSTINYDKYSSLRRECKELSHINYDSFVSGIETNLQQNPRKFFSYLNDLKGKTKNKSNNAPQCLSLNGVTASNSEESTKLLADHFSTVYSDEIIIPPYFGLSQSLVCLSHVQVTQNEVFKKLSTLQKSSSAGPDGVPPLLLRECAAELCYPLSLLFDKSLADGNFPEIWKNSFVNPLFKSGSKTDVGNYRPIAKISSIPKIFEALVLDVINKPLSSTLVSNQHGFIKGRSTLTNLTTFYQFLTNVIENGGQVDCCYTDFSKAFDKVNVNIMCAKLHSLGINDPLLSWFYSYLSTRTQIVKYNGCLSEPISVQSGCPQGGHLSGLLFNIFINDLILKIPENSGLLFADDFRLAKRINNDEDGFALQRALSLLSEWCSENRMVLNVKKCHMITFTRKINPLMIQYSIDGEELSRIYNVKDLGVTIDNDLKFNTHYTNIKNKAIKNLGFIQRNSKEFKSPQTLKALYSSIVRPSMEYCSSLWSPFCNEHIELLDKVQRKFLRILAFKHKIKIENHNYSEIIKISGLKSLKHRRDIADIVFLFKLLNNLIDCPDLVSQISLRVRGRTTRNTNLFATQFFRTNIGNNCPMNRILNIGNIVCNQPFNIDIFLGSVETLKSKLNEFDSFDSLHH